MCKVVEPAAAGISVEISFLLEPLTSVESFVVTSSDCMETHGAEALDVEGSRDKRRITQM